MIIKHEYILVYDESCPFCNALAHWLEKKADVKIVANTKFKVRGIAKEMLRKDVHLIGKISGDGWGDAKMVYSGAAAAAKVLSLKYEFIWSLYSFPPCGLAFKFSYLVLKKMRKYLSVVS